jgi:hypothetical protein
MMKVVNVTSSNIQALAYHAGNSSLYVLFKSGKAYSYAGVSAECFNQLALAKSHGRFLNQHIKPSHGVTVIADEERARVFGASGSSASEGWFVLALRSIVDGSVPDMSM